MPGQLYNLLNKAMLGVYVIQYNKWEWDFLVSEVNTILLLKDETEEE